MAKSGQYMPQRSQPLHFSAATTCGGWYPVELKAEESQRTWVGQNSTQNPQPLHRSTVMATKPLAKGPSRVESILRSSRFRGGRGNGSREIVPGDSRESPSRKPAGTPLSPVEPGRSPICGRLARGDIERSEEG